MDLDTSKNTSFFRFLNPFSARRKTEEAEKSALSEKELLRCLKSAREEWLDAGRSFEYADNEEITDYCTYKLKACEVRYDYFLKKAKESGIKTEELESAGLTFPIRRTG